MPELAKYKGANEHIILFSLSDDDANKMRVAQNRLKSIKDQDIQGNGSLSVNINIGCFHGPKPEKLTATIYALFNAEQGYITLVSNMNILEETSNGKNNFWVECDNHVQ